MRSPCEQTRRHWHAADEGQALAGQIEGAGQHHLVCQREGQGLGLRRQVGCGRRATWRWHALPKPS